MQAFEGTFSALAQTLDLGNMDLWSDFGRSAHCERDFPATVLRKLTPFQQVRVAAAAAARASVSFC